MKLLSFASLIVPAAAFVAPCKQPAFVRLAAQQQPRDAEANPTTTDQEKFLADAQHAWAEQSEHLRQLERSSWNDPDLANVVEDHPGWQHQPNEVFRTREQHRHDSLGHEIEHAIDSDPYLRSYDDKPWAHQVNNVFRNAQAHRHDSLLDEIQHAVDEDADLMA